MNYADGRIYPAKEMKALDMAELMRVAITDDGVIQGCRLTLDNSNRIMMTPGRIFIHGRIGVFEPHPEYVDPDSGDTINPGSTDTSTHIHIKVPDASERDRWSSDGERYICAVYNPAGDNPEKMYIDLLSQTAINTMAPEGSIFDPNRSGYDADFNALYYGAILKLGYVKISKATGEASNLDVSTTAYPAYGLHSNKKYVDGRVQALTDRETNRFNLLKKRDVYLTPNRADSYMGRHQIALFRNSTLSVDNVVVNATSSLTLTLRREIGSVALLYEEGQTRPSRPASGTPYVILKRQSNGTYSVDGADGESPGADPRRNPIPTEVYEGQTFYTELNTPELHRGIVGIRILNATTNGKGSANCVLQSYWTDIYSGSNWPNLDWRGHMYISIRNLGSSVARIKLEITSLYVRNSDYNYPAS